MKRYVVVCRKAAVLETDDIDEARKRVESMGDSSYIQYTETGIAVYEASHDPVMGEQE